MKKTWLRLRKIFEYRFTFGWRLKRAVPVIVYQMGKVASTTVYESLKNVYPGIVLHAHSLSSNHRRWQIRRIYKQVILKNGPINIISLTREPIGRNVSAFFENFKRDSGISYKKSKHSLSEIREIFLRNYQHDRPLIWFDNNIKFHFKIDVYATPFPDCGINTYHHKDTRLLVMRSEVSDDAKINAVKDFLSLSSLQLKNKNISSDKEYAGIYTLFKKEVNLPEDYINQMCGSKYFKHFYNKETITSIKNKWGGRNNNQKQTGPFSVP